MDVADRHAYVAGVGRAREEVFVTDPLQLQLLLDVAAQIAATHEVVQQFHKAWPASVAQCKTCSYLVVALAAWFLFNKGLWTLPKPADVFTSEAMTTQHKQK